MSKYSKAEREAAAATLREAFPSGSTAYTILRHCSRSGMSRLISVVAIRPDGELWHLDRAAAAVLGWPCKGNGEGVTVGGCGMDMGFHLVYSMSAAIHGRGDRGGYAVRQRWL